MEEYQSNGILVVERNALASPKPREKHSRKVSLTKAIKLVTKKEYPDFEPGTRNLFSPIFAVLQQEILYFD